METAADRGSGHGEGDLLECRGFVGQWKYSVRS